MKDNKVIYIVQGLEEGHRYEVANKLVSDLENASLLRHVGLDGFKQGLRKIMSFAESGTGALVVNSDRTSRRFRRDVYNRIKAKSPDVEVVVVMALSPYDDISLLDNVSLQSYSNFDVPRLDVDCDKVVVETKYDWFDVSNVDNWDSVVDVVDSAQLDFKSEIERVIGMPHDNAPYHMESISEHIDAVTKTELCQYNRNMKLIGLFHDLGKVITKKRNLNGVATYRCHEKVSAMYLMVLMSQLEGLNYENMSAVEVVYQHMNGHRGLGEKNIAKNKLERLKYTIELFAKSDSSSAVRGEGYVK